MTSPRTTRARLALGLWIAYGFIIWNVVFDLHVVQAGNLYRYRQTLALRGQGPWVSIDSIMQPAAKEGVWCATLWTLVTAVPGTVLSTLVFFRARRRRKGSEPVDR